jgi:hypothetical protein
MGRREDQLEYMRQLWRPYYDSGQKELQYRDAGDEARAALAHADWQRYGEQYRRGLHKYMSEFGEYPTECQQRESFDQRLARARAVSADSGAERLLRELGEKLHAQGRGVSRGPTHELAQAEPELVHYRYPGVRKTDPDSVLSCVVWDRKSNGYSSTAKFFAVECRPDGDIVFHAGAAVEERCQRDV